jgi:hypothetical protein
MTCYEFDGPFPPACSYVNPVGYNHVEFLLYAIYLVASQFDCYFTYLSLLFLDRRSRPGLRYTTLNYCRLVLPAATRKTHYFDSVVYFLSIMPRLTSKSETISLTKTSSTALASRHVSLSAAKLRR